MIRVLHFSKFVDGKTDFKYYGSIGKSFIGNRLRSNHKTVWFRLCEENLDMVENQIESELSSDSPSTHLGDVILSFYRVRDCLESNGVSEGFSGILNWK